MIQHASSDLDEIVERRNKKTRPDIAEQHAALPLHPENTYRREHYDRMSVLYPHLTFPKSIFPPGFETWDPVVMLDEHGMAVECATDRFPEGTFVRHDIPDQTRGADWVQAFKEVNMRHPDSDLVLADVPLYYLPKDSEEVIAILTKE